jgi:RNA recognition motif-containing protein
MCDLPPRREMQDDDRKIFVGNLNWRVSSDDLHDFFKQWGQIADARVIMDRDNPFRSRGFGFVTFENADDATQAIESSNEKEWQGRTMRVQLASAGSKPREPRPQY